MNCLVRETHARIVLNIHRASLRGVEASRVPGIHHPFKRAAEGRESRSAKRCQNVDEVTCEVEETPVDRRARLRKFCPAIYPSWVHRALLKFPFEDRRSRE